MGSGVLIADIDTGVDTTAPDLQGAISPLSWNFVTNSPSVDPVGTQSDYNHGTIVDGVMVARAGDGTGAAGVAPEAQVMALKCSDSSPMSESCIITAIQYAIGHGAKVINLSLGYVGSFVAGDPLLESAIRQAGTAGVLVVCAAGNWSNNNNNTPVYPASLNLPNMISVAASTNSDGLAGFSDYGSTSVDLAAPGEFIYTTEPGGSYGWENGTSLAAPMVSATAALIWAEDPSLTYSQVKTTILSTVDHPSPLAGTTVTGGRLNAAAAVAAVRPGVAFTFSGFNAVVPGSPSTVTVISKVTDPTVVPTGTPVALRVVLATEYNDGVYALVGQKIDWSYDETTGTGLTDRSGQDLVDSAGIGPDLATTGAAFSFPLDLPAGNYAMSASLVNPAEPGTAIAGTQAVFFTVASSNTQQPAPAPSSNSTNNGSTNNGSRGSTGTGTSGSTGRSTSSGGPSGISPITAPSGYTKTGSSGPTSTGGRASAGGSTSTGSASAGATRGVDPGSIPSGSPSGVSTGPDTTGTRTTPVSSPSPGAPGPASGSKPAPTAPSSGSASPTPGGPVRAVGMFGLTSITPSTVPSTGGDINVYGNDLPPNPVVKVGSQYEPVNSDLAGPGYISVSVGTLLPGQYSVTVLSASEAASGTLPNILTVTSTTTSNDPGVNSPTGGGSGFSGTGVGDTIVSAPTGPSSGGSSASGSAGTSGSSSAESGIGGGTSAGAGSGTSISGGATPGSTGPSNGITSSGTSVPGRTSNSAGGPTSTVPSSNDSAPGSMFLAPNGLELAPLSGSDLAVISVGSWPLLSCSSATCVGVSLG